MIKALELKMQQEIIPMSFIPRCSHCCGSQHTKEQAAHFHPDSWDHAQQGVCLWTGDRLAQRPHPEWLQGDSHWNRGSQRAQQAAVWRAPRFPKAYCESAGHHQVEGRPCGQQTVPEFQILEASEVPHACGKQTYWKNFWFGFSEHPGAVALVWCANEPNLVAPSNIWVDCSPVPDTGNWDVRRRNVKGIQASSFIQ